MGARLVLLLAFQCFLLSGGFCLADCPKSDFTHRRVVVPIYYDRAGLGSLTLYYELNSDFDPAKPTVFYLHDGQQTVDAVGGPDALKRKYRLRLNVLRMEHRGMPCSPLGPFTESGAIDWRKAYFAFRSANVVEDIERIRIDALGSQGRLHFFGGSGGGILVAQYLAKYGNIVERALLERTSDDLAWSARRQKEVFLETLAREGVLDDYLDLLKAPPVPIPELLRVLQRIGYDYYPTEQLTKRLLRGLRRQDLTLYREIVQAYEAPKLLPESAFAWVRVFETFPGAATLPALPTPIDSFEPMLRSLGELAREGLIPSKPINVHRELSGVSTEVLLVAARWDHVLPFEAMKAMNENMLNSRLITYDDTHGNLFNSVCHERLFKAFFEHGRHSEAVEAVLRSGVCRLWDEARSASFYGPKTRGRPRESGGHSLGDFRRS